MEKYVDVKLKKEVVIKKLKKLIKEVLNEEAKFSECFPLDIIEEKINEKWDYDYDYEDFDTAVEQLCEKYYFNRRDCIQQIE
jgi:hypothetical protein